MLMCKEKHDLQAVASLPRNLRDSVLQETQVPPPEQLSRAPDYLKVPCIHALFPKIAQDSALELDEDSSFIRMGQGHTLWPSLRLVPELNALKIADLQNRQELDALVTGLRHVTGLRRLILSRSTSRKASFLEG